MKISPANDRCLNSLTIEATSHFENGPILTSGSADSRPMRITDKLFASLLTIVLMSLVGCASHFDRLQPIRQAFFDGNLTAADEHVEKLLKKKRKGERDVLMLDKAIIELASGRPKDAEQILRKVRDSFDDLEDFDTTKAVASMLTDDNARAYAGEDYEKVLIRAMLSISNLMSGGGDAGAYALQMVDKQQQVIQTVEEKHKEENKDAVLAFKQVALGPYIRGMLAEESPTTLNDAVRARVQVANWEPNFRDAKKDLQRCEHEVPMHPGNGALYVFALVGRGPIKQEAIEPVSQIELLLADRLFNAFANRNIPPTLAPVKVPQVVNFYKVLNSLKVAAVTLAASYRAARGGKTHQDVLVAWVIGIAYVVMDDLRLTLEEVL